MSTQTHPHRLAHLLPSASFERVNAVLGGSPNSVPVSALIIQLDTAPCVTPEDVHFYTPLFLAVMGGRPMTTRTLANELGIKPEVIRSVLRARPKDFGRHGNHYLPKVNADRVFEMISIRGAGMLKREIADDFGVSVDQITRLVNELRASGRVQSGRRTRHGIRYTATLALTQGA